LEYQTSIVIAVHDLNRACRFADSVMILQGGAIAGSGKLRDVLDPDRIRAGYGVHIRIEEDGFG
jgi:iron complex transport system ATP-binding protein